ncbi:hypothetical protein N7444_005076 [Penicillium canescens]|nr:hypothetical protein N7444_005076 [Penicillium canescens]
MDDIEDRLRSHAQAFDGLLSLIPAKYYYGEENTSDQWQRKKQTKEQAREAKRAKLDPEAAKTAKDVMDENARKRKREDGTIQSDSSDGEMGTENPKEGLNRGNAKPKKQKSVENGEKDATKAAEVEARKKQNAEKKAAKKAEQKEKKKAKDIARKEKAQQNKKQSNTTTEDSEKSAPKPNAPKPNGDATKKPDASDDEEDDENEEEDGVVEEGFSLEFNDQPENSSASSTPHSPNASNPQSGSSSISSIVPPSASTEAKSSEPKPLKHTPEELKQRLQKRLDELRAKRHADGLNGKPARNRQELIEARRQKAEQRKAHKKELRQKAKDEEQLKSDEAMARRFSPGGSGSLLASPRSPAESVGSSSNNFSFGRMIFSDGQATDAAGTDVHDKPKTHGARDPAAQLKAAEAKRARLAEMDPAKRADIEEKDRWLNAKKRAHGERVRDDTSLLKKALKRKETAKKKSEREWKDRLDTVARSKEQRQSKRDENLRKRRDEKGNKGARRSPAAVARRRPLVPALKAAASRPSQAGARRNKSKKNPKSNPLRFKP